MFRSATLALFNRSLREDTRKATPYFARMGLAALILLFLSMAHMSMGFSRTTTAGLTFFTMVIWINVVFFTVVGLSHFASAITEEKEEMTLGLLRMTNLNSLSILLGKSTNRLFLALLYLVAQFPFTLLAVTLGGVAVSQVIAAYVSLAAYIILLANLALFFSVLCRRTYSAAFFSFVSLLVVVLGIWIAHAVAQIFLNLGIIQDPKSMEARLPEILAECTVASRLSDVLSTGFSDGPLCAQVISNVVIALVLFLLSWLIFDLATRSQLGAEAGPSRSLTAKVRRGRRWWFTPGRPGVGAVFWKDRNFLHNGRAGLLIRMILLGALFFVIIPGFSYLMMTELGRRPISLDEFVTDIESYGLVVAWLAFLLGLLQVGLSAGRIFREEIRWQTLSSLAMLPKSMRAIAYQKVAAALVSVLPFIIYFVIGIALAPNDVGALIEDFLEDDTGISFAFLVFATSQFVLATHLITLLSIYLKWGAFALGIFLMVIANMAFGMMAAMSIDSNEGAVAMLLFGGIASIVAAVGCHEAIGHGLKNAAAKE